jgi:hypothetical protein
MMNVENKEQLWFIGYQLGSNQCERMRSNLPEVVCAKGCCRLVGNAMMMKTQDTDSEVIRLIGWGGGDRGVGVEMA